MLSKILNKFYDADADNAASGGDDKFEVLGTFSMGDIINQQTDTDNAADDTDDSASDSNSGSDDTNSSDGSDGSDKGGTSDDSAAAGGSDDSQTKHDEKPGDASDSGASQDQDTNKGDEVSLADLLKGRDKREVLKALNVSEEVFDALDSASTLSELKAFIDTRTRNWDEVSDTDVLREDFRKKYGDLPEAKFEKLFAAELKKYNLDSLDDEEKELGQIRLEIDAKTTRDRLKGEQAQFKLPERKPTAEAQELEAIHAQQAKAKTDLENFTSGIRSADATKQLLQNKRLVLADGYQFDVVNPDQLIEAVIDTPKMFAGCVKEDGSLDLVRVYKIVNYALNTDAVENSYMEHGRTKENDDTFNELVNPSKRDAPTSTNENESLGQAFANRGTNTTLGSILGF
jgi:hypothetical protein